MFAPDWQFNVVVENLTRGDIALDPEATGLYVRRPGGGFDRVEGVPAVGLLLTFRESRRTFRVDFPLEDIVTVVPPPAPTAIPDGGRTTG